MHRSMIAALLLPTISFTLISGAYAAENTTSTHTQVYEHKTEQYVDDSTITARIKAKQAVDEIVKATSVYVETYKGNVQLAGFVRTDTEKSRAAEIAKGVKGVKDIKNDIIVMP